MTNDSQFSIELTFPGNIGYIPSVRKFVAETLQACNFGPKFIYRSEIVVDEVCNNAVAFGCKAAEAMIQLAFQILPDRIEFVIKDQGGSPEDRERLRKIVEGKKGIEVRSGSEKGRRNKLGLEIVRMFSEELNFEIDDRNLTSVRVVRKRDDIEAAVLDDAR